MTNNNILPFTLLGVVYSWHYKWRKWTFSNSKMLSYLSRRLQIIKLLKSTYQVFLALMHWWWVSGIGAVVRVTVRHPCGWGSIPRKECSFSHIAVLHVFWLACKISFCFWISMYNNTYLLFNLFLILYLTSLIIVHIGHV